MGWVDAKGWVDEWKFRPQGFKPNRGDKGFHAESNVDQGHETGHGHSERYAPTGGLGRKSRGRNSRS